MYTQQLSFKLNTLKIPSILSCFLIKIVISLLYRLISISIKSCPSCIEDVCHFDIAQEIFGWDKIINGSTL